MKRHDSEMQSLVYENYNKFISASDIIRQMKSNVDSLDNEMRLLTANMESVVQHADTLSENLSANRLEMQRLANATEFFDKIQFLLHLPGKMQGHLAVEGYGEVVRLYNTYGRMLARFSQLPALRDVASETQALVDSTRQHLRTRVGHAVSKDELNHDIRLLLSLDDDAEGLRNLYLDKQTGALDRVLDASVAQIQATRGTSTVHPVSVLCHAFVLAFMDFARNYDAIFASKPGEVEAASAAFDKTSRTIVGRFLGLVKSEFLTPCASALVLLNGLNECKRDIARLQQALPNVALAKKTAELLSNAVRWFVDGSFAAVKDRMHSAIAGMLSSSKPFLGAVDGAIEAINAALDGALEALKPLASSKNYVDTDGVLATSVHVKAQQVLLFLHEAVMAAAAPMQASRSLDQGAGGRVLMLARLCTQLVADVVSTYVRRVYAVFAVQAHVLEAHPIEAELTRTMSLLLVLYVETAGQTVAHDLRALVAGQNWLIPAYRGSKSPVAPVVDVLHAVHAEIQTACARPGAVGPASGAPGGASAAAGSLAGAGASGHRRTGSAFEFKRMDEVAASRESSALTLAPNALMVEVLTIAVKALNDAVRMASFASAGLAVFEADVAALRSAALTLVESERLMASLFDEVARSLRDRSLQ